MLGAVLGPTDPVAATAIAGRVGAPRRVVTVLEGESLVNDATALIAFRFAVAAVVTGSFSLVDAVGEFALGHRRRRRHRHRRRRAHRRAAAADRRPADGGGAHAPDAVLRLPPGGGARPLRRRRRRHRRHLLGDARAADLHADEPAAAQRAVGARDLPAQRRAVRARRAAAARRSSTRSTGYGAGEVARLRRGRDRHGGRRALPLGLPGDLAAAGRSPGGSASAIPGRGWQAPFAIAFTGMRGAVSLAAALSIPEIDRGRRRVPVPRPDHLPHVRDDRLHGLRRGAHAAGAAARARARRRRAGAARGGQGAAARRGGRAAADRGAARARTGCATTRPSA